jgi:uncharacterized damage-inducible protein DinB
MRVEDLKRQFELSWDMLDEVFEKCTGRIWRAEKIKPYSIARLMYHTVWWTQRYCRHKKKVVELDPFNFGREGDSVAIERMPDIAEMRAYSNRVRKRIMKWLDSMEDSGLCESDGGFEHTGETIGERLVYSLKHIHHHLGQMNLLLRQSGKDAVEWRCVRR